MTARAASRERGWRRPSARISTARCCPGIRGSRTGCWRAPSSTQESRPSSTRSQTTPSTGPRSARPSAQGPEAAAPRNASSRGFSEREALLVTRACAWATADHPPLSILSLEFALVCAGMAPKRARTRSEALRRPERAQIHNRVARAPAGQEALNGRVQHDLVQLADVEEPVSTHRCVARRHRLERPPLEVAREDDVNDVLRSEAAHRSDRVDDRHRALDGNLVVHPHLLGELAMQRADEALARVHTASRQQPVRAALLLVSAEEDAPAPAQDRRHPDARLGRHYASSRLDEPNPRTPRSVPGSSSTSAVWADAIGTTTSWAIRIPGSTTNAASSVFSRITRTSPR